MAARAHAPEVPAAAGAVACNRPVVLQRALASVALAAQDLLAALDAGADATLPRRRLARALADAGHPPLGGWR